MRVAIIGYSGAGRTTLAHALAAVIGARTIHDLNDIWEPLAGTDGLVLDGIPSSIEELRQIDARAARGETIDRVLYLEASAELRLRRIARMIAAGTDPARARDRMLRAADLKKLRDHLDATGRLVHLDATSTRTQVLATALDSLGIAI